MITLWLGCNTAPLDRSLDMAPDGKVPWAQPGDEACIEHDDEDEILIDGFHYCGYLGGSRKIPIDDPVFDSCSIVLPSDEPYLYVTDGVQARAYQISMLLGREVVNDQWGDEALLVDY